MWDMQAWDPNAWDLNSWNGCTPSPIGVVNTVRVPVLANDAATYLL